LRMRVLKGVRRGFERMPGTRGRLPQSTPTLFAEPDFPRRT
jgi:hypothetical protein